MLAQHKLIEDMIHHAWAKLPARPGIRLPVLSTGVRITAKSSPVHRGSLAYASPNTPRAASTGPELTNGSTNVFAGPISVPSSRGIIMRGASSLVHRKIGIVTRTRRRARHMGRISPAYSFSTMSATSEAHTRVAARLTYPLDDAYDGESVASRGQHAGRSAQSALVISGLGGRFLATAKGHHMQGSEHSDSRPSGRHQHIARPSRRLNVS
ncbi:uncharacterized protein BCR38DRAFT_406413 [Pseudomassariella vexata]|uniref:Uncharacterized protein n=1 Tax=Pseudomassariella vexata TaxID=1141098 RepID=A0A1Y2EA94_9PEZI|nr:uncharacterized protein BCR38DRAFT_406413 [Pseudomassariella vexata]ORY68493.1 hypothetical protein BCR38DRAFT_406413 [Pseudomassariella vexata]